jgi:diguanylate cyclase (GGDEF)-like protein
VRSANGNLQDNNEYYDSRKMVKKQASEIKKAKCWEVFKCNKEKCPAYKSKDLRCWLFSGTHCRDEIQGKFLEKMEICIDCKVFKADMNTLAMRKTLELVNKQLKEFRQIVDNRDRALKRLATIDKLTGTYNRRKVEEIIEREMGRFRRLNKPLSMVIFDIDNFKKINDTYGHNIGDYVLRKIVSIAKKTIRKIDYLIRWGGEEFMIISSETDMNEAHALAERIRRAIESYMFKNVGKVTASFGVTEFREGDTEDTFIKRADDVMYEAKIKGKNRVELTT